MKCEEQTDRITLIRWKTLYTALLESIEREFVYLLKVPLSVIHITNPLREKRISSLDGQIWIYFTEIIKMGRDKHDFKNTDNS